MSSTYIYTLLIYLIFIGMFTFVVAFFTISIIHDYEVERANDRDKRKKRKSSKFGTNSRERRKVQTDKTVGKGLGKGGC